MAEVNCSRCGNTAAGLERAPLPGDVGDQVLVQTCGACWQEWMAMQVKLINENALTPAKPDDYSFLVQEMSTFLGLREE